MAGYSKEGALERIFHEKFDPNEPQGVIPFSMADVRDAILANGEVAPGNLHNFVFDLVRHGDDSPRVQMASELGYRLRRPHGGARGEFGEFYLPVASSLGFLQPADNLEPQIVPNRFHPAVNAIIRPDEGGLIAAIDLCHLLEFLFDLTPGAAQIVKVQSPVKLQPHEVDGLWLRLSDEEHPEHVLLAVETKSVADVIPMNQMIGNARTALESVAPGVITRAVSIGAKFLPNYDIYVVALPEVGIADLPRLDEILRPDNRSYEKILRLEPLPPYWRPRTRRR